MPRKPDVPAVSGPTAGSPVRTTSAMLFSSLTRGSFVPAGTIVSRTTSPDGRTSNTACHSGRAASALVARSCACARPSSETAPNGSVKANDCNAETVRRSSLSIAVASARVRLSADSLACWRCCESSASSAIAAISASGTIASVAISTSRDRIRVMGMVDA